MIIGALEVTLFAQQTTNKSIWLDPNAYEGTHEPQITVSRILPAESASVTDHTVTINGKKVPYRATAGTRLDGTSLALYKPPFSIPSMSVPMWNPTSEKTSVNIL